MIFIKKQNLNENKALIMSSKNCSLANIANENLLKIDQISMNLFVRK